LENFEGHTRNMSNVVSSNRK
ncbi:hypothetical protein NPIL_558991, partial [Nephila pilipes]